MLVIASYSNPPKFWDNLVYKLTNSVIINKTPKFVNKYSFALMVVDKDYYTSRVDYVGIT